LNRPIFSLERATVRLSLLREHEIVSKLGYLKPDEIYANGVKELNLPEFPIVTEDHFYLTSPDYIDVLKAESDQYDREVEVFIVKGASINNLFQIVQFKSRPWYKASKSLLYKSVKVFQYHLWNTDEGRSWRDCLDGNDINEVLGKLFGYSASTISNVKAVGDYNYALLDQIDDPDANMTLTKALFLISEEKKLNSGKQKLSHVNLNNFEDEKEYDDVDTTDDIYEEEADDTSADQSEKGNVKNGGEAKVTIENPKHLPTTSAINLTSFSVGFGSIGEFHLDLSTGTPAILHNDQFAGLVTITPSRKNNPDEGVHFVLQNHDNGWGFQVVAKRMSRHVKTQEVESKRA